MRYGMNPHQPASIVAGHGPRVFNGEPSMINYLDALNAFELVREADDATGAPAAVRAMVDMVASAGRAVQVGMSNEEAPIRVGVLTEKELDLLGVSCCGDQEFADAVAVVERNGAALGRLISHEFPLEQAPDAMSFAIANPAEVMKVVIRSLSGAVRHPAAEEQCRQKAQGEGAGNDRHGRGRHRQPLRDILPGARHTD